MGRGGGALARNNRYFTPPNCITQNEETNKTLSQPGCLLGGVYVLCIYRMPGGVIVGDSGPFLLWACVQCVTRQLLERNYDFPLFVVPDSPS